MGLPMRWDDRLEQVRMKGNFCSPGCVVAYARDRQSQMVVPFSIGAMQKLIRKTLGVSYTSITAAPPRETLRMFGGWLDIDEFRKQTFYQVRQLRRDELVSDWVPDDYAITLWGRLVTVKGVPAADLQDKLQNHRKRPAQTGSEGLDSFLQIKKTKI